MSGCTVGPPPPASPWAGPGPTPLGQSEPACTAVRGLPLALSSWLLSSACSPEEKGADVTSKRQLSRAVHLLR